MSRGLSLDLVDATFAFFQNQL